MMMTTTKFYHWSFGCTFGSFNSPFQRKFKRTLQYWKWKWHCHYDSINDPFIEAVTVSHWQWVVMAVTMTLYTEYKTESHWQCHFLDDIYILGHSPMDNGTSLTVTLSYWHCHDDSKNDQVIETVIKSHWPLWLQQRSQLIIKSS